MQDSGDPGMQDSGDPEMHDSGAPGMHDSGTPRCLTLAPPECTTLGPRDARLWRPRDARLWRPRDARLWDPEMQGLKDHEDNKQRKFAFHPLPETIRPPLFNSNQQRQPVSTMQDSGDAEMLGPEDHGPEDHDDSNVSSPPRTFVNTLFSLLLSSNQPRQYVSAMEDSGDETVKVRNRYTLLYHVFRFMLCLLTLPTLVFR